jgi:hypothetical protein
MKLTKGAALVFCAMSALAVPLEANAIGMSCPAGQIFVPNRRACYEMSDATKGCPAGFALTPAFGGMNACIPVAPANKVVERCPFYFVPTCVGWTNFCHSGGGGNYRVCMTNVGCECFLVQ